MRLTVFGGTGPTGRLLIDDALAAGHTVTAFARTPGTLPIHQKLNVIAGQLTEAPAVQRAISGSDAVLSLLGTTRAADVDALTAGYRAIVAGMKNTGVKRLVALGTSSNADPADSRELKVDLAVKISSILFPAPYRLFVAIGEIVRDSGLQWTFVRVPFLTNGPRTDNLNVRMKGEKGGMRVSRANVAAFFLEQARDTSRIGTAPYITDR